MDNWLFLEQLVSTYIHVVVILKVFLQSLKSQDSIDSIMTRLWTR
jgi:hypothetical protein